MLEGIVSTELLERAEKEFPAPLSTAPIVQSIYDLARDVGMPDAELSA